MNDVEHRKVMLVTGASRGIGRAVARLAASRGYDLCLNYVHDEASARSLQQEVEAVGVKAIIAQANVGVEEDVLQLFDSVDQHLGSLDVLINNAGILFQQKKLIEFDADRVNQILTTNVTSAILCAREAIKRMAFSHGGVGGSIVNLSSIAALVGAPNEYIDYAASKGAIDAMTTGLAKETASEGIRVNAVRPGLIFTDIHASGGDPGRVERLQASVPMQRGGTAEEVANAVIWLASDEASYVTGSFINVSGGR